MAVLTESTERQFLVPIVHRLSVILLALTLLPLLSKPCGFLS